MGKHEDVKLGLEQDDYKVIAELSGNRFLIETKVRNLKTNKQLLKLRTEHPEAGDRSSMASDIKTAGLIYAIQTLPELVDGRLVLIVWDGHQRREAAMAISPDQVVEVVVWSDMTIEIALERGTAANFLRFAAEEHDIFILFDHIEDQSRVERLTGLSSKQVGRYKKLHDSGFRKYIGAGCFNPTYGLKLCALAPKDEKKLASLLDVVERLYQLALKKKDEELQHANVNNQKPDEEKLKLTSYFTDDALDCWTIELENGKTILSVDFSHKYKPVKTGAEKDWEKGIPKFGIEGRNWTDLGNQHDQLREIANRLLLEAEYREADFKRHQAKKALLKKARAKNVGIQEDDGLVTTRDQDLPKAE